jgi:putative transposase
MLNGFKTSLYPKPSQKKVLDIWGSASNFIYRAKCEEDKYLREFAKKYLPSENYPKIDQTYSQYKNEEFSPWLKKCPSQILRNSASNWYTTYQNFYKKRCNRPKVKRKKSYSIFLTKELFKIEIDKKQIKLFIGTLSNNIGYISVNWHNKKFLKTPPSSIRIKKSSYGKYTLSFCYGEEIKEKENKYWLDYLKMQTEEELNKLILGVDRGVNVICACDDKRIFTTTIEERKKLNNIELKKKRYQKRISRQIKTSNRRKKIKNKLAKIYDKKKNINTNICHNISKKLVESDQTVIVFEDLKTKNMTRSAKGSIKKPGKNVKQKSGLNREILNRSWHKIEQFTIYKANKVDKVVFKVDPKHTSQECACCGHIHPENRKGKKFKCKNKACENEDHADINAGKVIKKRAIKLILHSGTELSKNRVLSLSNFDKGRGDHIRADLSQDNQPRSKKRQKRKIA